MKVLIPILIVALYIAILSPIKAQNTNWPQFRGINSSGIAPEGQDFSVKFNKEDNLEWTVTPK